MTETGNEIRAILLDQAGKLLADHVTKDAIDAAEKGAWPEALWRALEETGLTRAAVPEAQGGAGASFGDAMALLRLAGRFGAPVPLAETLIGGWLLARGGVTPPAGALSFATDPGGSSLTLERTASGWSVSGSLRRVPWGRRAAALVAIADGPGGEPCLAAIPATAASVAEGKNIAGEPRDGIAFETAALAEDAVGPLPNDAGREALAELGALSRTVLIAGALEKVLDLSVTHALDRRQFGRPIAKFQAIQQELAVLAGETAAAGAAADAAVEAVEAGGGLFHVAAAKIRAGEAAGQAATIAHQVHGAMGFTYEHPLHQLTRRLWAWRDEFGTDADWAIRLGALAVREGGGPGSGLWPLITAS